MRDNILNIKESEEIESTEEQNPEELELAAKQLAVKDMLGVEGLDVSNLSAEELDNIMVKAAQAEQNGNDETESKVDAIQKKYGTDNLNLDGLSDEELDTILLGKNVTEKVEFISSRFDEKKATYYIHKYTGMSLSESKYVYNDLIKETNLNG